MSDTTNVVPLKANIVEANKDSNDANHKALARATIIQVQKRKEMAGTTTAEQSTSIPNDPLSALASRGDVIEPPFDMLTLSMLSEHSTELGQCVDAMVVNVHGFGHRFVPRVATDDPTAPEELKKKIQVEKVRLENFFMYAGLQDSFIEFRSKLGRDMETTGNAYFEVIRGLNGAIQGFVHLPAYNMRLGRVEDKHVPTMMPQTVMNPDGSVEIKKVKVWRRFRTYAQSRAIYTRNLTAYGGYKTVWFKEFGDERVYNNETGELVPADKLAEFPDDQRANEVVHFRLYSPRTPYGLPRFIGNLLSIFGDRAAEEINFITFKNNNIPSMVVCVSNGQLTQGSVNRIQDFVESQIQGSDNYSKFLVLEAEGSEEGEDGSQIKIDVKPLVQNQHKDALFQNYSEKNQDKIRRSFRLPPIFVGRADDYTRATADSSRRLADEQVFAPERERFDAWVNRILFPEMGIVFHRYKTNSPNTTDNTALTKILSDAEKTGGMTPRIARDVLSEILSRDLPSFPEAFPADVPFSLTMAEMVKNEANAAEPGQQVTAIKNAVVKAHVGEVFKSQPDEALGDEDKEVERLLNIRKKLEKRMHEEVAAMGDDTSDIPKDD